MQPMPRWLGHSAHAPHGLLLLAVALGMLLAACGGSSATPATAPVATTAATKVSTAPPQATTAATKTATTAPATATTAPATATLPPAPTTTTAASSVTTAQGSTDELSKRLVAVVDAMNKQQRFRLSIVANNPKQPDQQLQITYEVVRPDKLHMTMASPVDPSQTIEIIGIGNTTYVKQGGAWQAAPVPLAASALLPVKPDEEYTKAIEQLGQVGTKVTGTSTETLDGVVCEVWKVSMTTSDGKQDALTYYVGKDDHLIRKITGLGGPGGTMTYTYLGDDFDIKPPI